MGIDPNQPCFLVVRFHSILAQAKVELYCAIWEGSNELNIQCFQLGWGGGGS